MINQQYEMRFVGSGGQGVILASVIFAEAAVISGFRTSQSQSYGPEARGGMCKAETIVSRESIWFTKVTDVDFMLALNSKAYEKYVPDCSEKTLIIADESLGLKSGKNLVVLPIIHTAVETVGKEVTTNIVAVGAVNAVLGLFSDEVIEEAVWRHIPKGTEELNLKALKAGKALISEKTSSKYSVR